MVPLPAPLWVEGHHNGEDIAGVAIALLRYQLTPKHPDLAEGTHWDKECGFYEFIVMDSSGQVLELHTDCAKVIRPHDGYVYNAYLEGCYDNGVGNG